MVNIQLGTLHDLPDTPYGLIDAHIVFNQGKPNIIIPILAKSQAR